MEKDDFRANDLSERDSSPRNEVESGSEGIGTHRRENLAQLSLSSKETSSGILYMERNIFYTLWKDKSRIVSRFWCQWKQRHQHNFMRAK